MEHAIFAPGAVCWGTSFSAPYWVGLKRVEESAAPGLACGPGVPAVRGEVPSWIGFHSAEFTHVAEISDRDHARGSGPA